MSPIVDKTRRERIDWIEAPGGVMVARVGRGWAHYWGSLRRVCIYRADGGKVAQFDANSIRSATRKIRAWRKRK